MTRELDTNSGPLPDCPEGDRFPLRTWTNTALVFLVAFVPRAIYPVSRSMLWYYRSISFFDALLAGDWKATYQSYHPGVTTTWFAGIGIRIFGWITEQSSDQLLGIEPAQPGIISRAVTAGVIPLALVIALCIALAYLLLRDLFGPRIGLAGGLLLALDPFHLAQSKALHVDGLLATFMFLSALFLLNYIHNSRKRCLLLSGVFAGLAFLTKSPSVFLIPYGVLSLVAGRLALPSCDTLTASRIQRVIGTAAPALRDLLIWATVAIVVFVVSWPAMWADPLLMLDRMTERVTYHVSSAHYNPVFFNGQITFGDPGFAFYLATLAWKTTLISLPMALLGLALAGVRIRKDPSGRGVLLLGAYVLFFTLQMGISERKEPRYLLPVFPVVDVVAAYGLVHICEAVGRIGRARRFRWLSAALISVALLTQAALVLPHHPYYGTHYNDLLGGGQVAQRILPLQYQGAGLDLAAQYLNSLPRVEQSRAMIHPLGAELFEREFRGYTTSSDDPWIDYHVFYVNQIMRRLDSAEWEEIWIRLQDTEPLWSVSFDGVEYVWVYGAPPDDPTEGGPQYDVDYQLGERIRLTEVRLSSREVARGASLVVAPVWEAVGDVSTEFMVFCHIRSSSGAVVAQRDGPPIYGVRPTPGWRVGDVIEDSYEIFIGQDLQPGDYELSLGMYDPETLDRVPAYTADGERLPGDRIVIDVISVE